MSLTRKHFNELAEIFKQFQPVGENILKQYPMWNELRIRIAEFCAEHNDNFDYDRFMKASENDDTPTTP